MKLFKLNLFHKSQAGFTLVEMLAALAITSILSLGASVSSIQILNQTSRDNAYTVASRNTVNALDWISRDALMAQSIAGCDGFPETESLAFTWTGWDNNICSANYSVTDGELRRVYSDGSNVYSTYIAANISGDGELTWCTSENGTITVAVTGSIGEGDRAIAVTKSRIITNRTKL